MKPHDQFGWEGQIIDAKYRVERAVGEGAFGVVYRAHHLGFEEPVALKCLKLPPGLAGAERDEFYRRFSVEGRLLNRLSRSSTSIVQALDLGAATSPHGVWTPYLVLEWLEGVSLGDDLDRRAARGEGGRGLAAAVALLEPAALALGAAHQQHVAHRDVKPANLFLARVAGRPTIKVLDFGIAKVFDGESMTKLAASTGGALHAFSPLYAAPEQFDRRYGATGPWTDVFALALVVIEVASGRPALDGQSLGELFVRATDRVLRPGLRARDVPCSDDVERVVQRALHVEPAARYANALEFWGALVHAVRAGGAPAEIGAELASSRPGAAARWSRPGAASRAEPRGLVVPIDGAADGDGAFAAPLRRPPPLVATSPPAAPDRPAPPAPLPPLAPVLPHTPAPLMFTPPGAAPRASEPPRPPDVAPPWPDQRAPLGSAPPPALLATRAPDRTARSRTPLLWFGALASGAALALTLARRDASPERGPAATTTASAQAPAPAAGALAPESRGRPAPRAPRGPATAGATTAAALVAREVRVPAGFGPARPGSERARVGDFVVRGLAGGAPRDYLAAHRACRGAGLALCTEAQWQLACEAGAPVGADEAWTASIEPRHGAVARGGAGGCGDRRIAPPAEALGARGQVCCSRTAGWTFEREAGVTADEAERNVLAFEAAFNRHDAGALRAMLDDELRFFRLTDSRERVGGLLAKAFRAEPDIWVLHESCALDGEGDAWSAECHKLAGRASELALVVTRYEFARGSGRVRSLTDERVLQPFTAAADLAPESR